MAPELNPASFLPFPNKQNSTIMVGPTRFIMVYHGWPYKEGSPLASRFQVNDFRNHSGKPDLQLLTMTYDMQDSI